MNKIMACFKLYIKSIWNDFMLIACLFAPILMGIAFKVLIPLLENSLIKSTGNVFITPYYPLFDLVLAIMTPTMFAFTGILTMLEELDTNTARYEVITPLGRNGYIIAKIVIPSIIGFIYSFILLLICEIGNLNILMLIFISILGSLISVIVSLFVISYAKNKVEGMALTKTCGIMIIPIVIVAFIDNLFVYVLSVLPTFWMSKMVLSGNYLYILPSLVISILFIFVLKNKFNRKII